MRLSVFCSLGGRKASARKARKESEMNSRESELRHQQQGSSVPSGARGYKIAPALREITVFCSNEAAHTYRHRRARAM